MGRQYTNNEMLTFIRSNLRKLWMISPARQQALLDAETATPKLKKDGTPYTRTYKKTGKTIQIMDRTYTCQKCGKAEMKNRRGEMSVDHFYPTGPTPGKARTPKFWTWDIFIQRLLFPKRVWVLCEPCHKMKTIKDKAYMKDEKNLEKIAKEFYESADK